MRLKKSARRTCGDNKRDREGRRSGRTSPLWFTGVISPMNASQLRILFVLAAALAAPSVGAFAGDVKPSQLACDARKIGARDLADCLRTAADRADKELAAEVDVSLKSVDARTGVLNAQKSRWKRSLNEAEDQWVSWRDVECQDVAPFEAGMSAKGGDPRLSCIIDRDAERVGDLKARYP
jgi:uncharacterized protein YecT (DUF1311 family)